MALVAVGLRVRFFLCLALEMHQNLCGLTAVGWEPAPFLWVAVHVAFGDRSCSSGKFLAALKGRAQKQRRWLWPQDCGTAVIRKGLSMFSPCFPSVDSKGH